MKVSIPHILRIITASLICSISFSAKAQTDTMYTVCNGNWEDSTTWSNKKTPGPNDYIIIYNHVVYSTPINLPLPASIYIAPSGSLCGHGNITANFTNYGIFEVADTIRAIGSCSSYDTLINTNEVIIAGAGNGFFSTGYDCVGCTFTCAPILPCYKPVAQFTSPRSICQGQSIQFTDESTQYPYKWYWSFPGGNPSTSTQQNPLVVYNTSGIYSVTLIAANSVGSDTITKAAWINVNPLPLLTVCCDSTISPGQPVQLSATGGNTYQWAPSSGLSCNTCPNPVATVINSNTYTVITASDSGCKANGSVNIEVLCGDVFIPQAFSPNGDGQNDKLYVRGNCIQTLTLMIFDRWGNKVFETNNQGTPWDGTYKGQPLNTGTYSFYLTATLYTGNTVIRKGSIELVK